jgi:hypothetical protein
MSQLVEMSLVYYHGKNQLLRTMIALNGGSAVAITEADKTYLWLKDGSEFEVKKSDIEHSQWVSVRANSDILAAFYQGEIKQLPAKVGSLPPASLIAWAAGKTLSEIKRSAKKAGFTIKQGISAWRWHREMARYDFWDRTVMEKCWEKALANTTGTTR